MIEIKRSVWDSIQMIANKPPVITIDTFYKETKVPVYITKPVPVPVKENDSILTYNDSIVNKDINIHMKYKVKGELVSNDYLYYPVYKEIVKEIEKFVPQIVHDPPAKYDTRTFKPSFYLGYLRGRENGHSVGFDCIVKDSYIVGWSANFYGQVSFVQFKAGIIFK